MRLGFPLSLRSFAHLGLVVFVLDFLHLGFSASARSTTCLALSFFLLTRVAMDSLLFVSDFLHLEPFILLQSHSQLGFPLSMLEWTRFGSLLSSRAMACLGSTLLASGLTRLGSVFFLPVIDVTTFGSLLPIRSLACSGPFTLALDLLHLDSSLLPRGCCHLELAFLMFGATRLGPTSLPLEHASLGLFLPLRSMSCSGSAVLVLDHLRLDFILSLQSFAHAEFAFFVFGIMETGPSLPPLECLTPGLFLPARSYVCIDFASFVLDLLHPASLMFLRSVA